eukprot:gene3867-biopygen3808
MTGSSKSKDPEDFPPLPEKHGDERASPSPATPMKQEDLLRQTLEMQRQQGEIQRQQAEEHRLPREQLHWQAEINVALEAEVAAKSGTSDSEGVAKSAEQLLERRRNLAYVPEASVNLFPPRPATITTRMPQLYDPHGNKTYDALSKKSNYSMKYECLVLAPALSYLHDVVGECNASLDESEDGELSYDELQKRFHVVTNSVHGVYAMLCNWWTMLELRGQLEQEPGSSQRGGADALRAKPQFVEDRVYQAADGFVADEVLQQWLNDFDNDRGKAVLSGKKMRWKRGPPPPFNHRVSLTDATRQQQILLGAEKERLLADAFTGLGQSVYLAVPAAQLYLREVYFELAEKRNWGAKSLLDLHDIELQARYIRSEVNVWADNLSRCEDLDDWGLNRKWFVWASAQWGPFTVDRFASEISAQLLRYYAAWKDPRCEGVDSLAYDWLRENNWVNPPWALLDKVAHKLREEWVAATVVAPYCSKVTVGSKIEVFWKDNDCFYPGVVKDFNEDSKAHVLNDNGGEETLDLSEENFKIICSSGVSELTDETVDVNGENIDRGGDYKENKRGGAVENFLMHSLYPPPTLVEAPVLKQGVYLPEDSDEVIAVVKVEASDGVCWVSLSSYLEPGQQRLSLLHACPTYGHINAHHPLFAEVRAVTGKGDFEEAIICGRAVQPHAHPYCVVLLTNFTLMDLLAGNVHFPPIHTCLGAKSDAASTENTSMLPKGVTEPKALLMMSEVDVPPAVKLLDMSLVLKHMDVDTAFLNSVLEEDLYVRLPRGLEYGGHRCAKLLKAVYGLKQAGKEWFETSDAFIMGYDWRMMRSDVEPCFYFIRDTELKVIILAYVDDYLVATNDKSWYENFVVAFHSEYACKDLGVLDLVMGIGVRWEDGTAYLSQRAYVSQMIRTYGLTDAKPATLPMSPGATLSPSDGKDTALPYRALLGQLPWVARCSRPDIMSTVSTLSRLCSTYGPDHLVALNQAVRYLKGTLDYELGAIHLATDNVNNSRSKHIEVRNMYIRELIKAKETEALYTGTVDNTSDIMTKPLALPIFRVHRESDWV